MTRKRLNAMREHGEFLLKLFPNAVEKDPVELYKKLRKQELRWRNLTRKEAYYREHTTRRLDLADSIWYAVRDTLKGIDCIGDLEDNPYRALLHFYSYHYTKAKVYLRLQFFSFSDRQRVFADIEVPKISIIDDYDDSGEILIAPNF